MGDIIDWNEQHMLIKTSGHAAVIKKNLLAALQSSAASGSNTNLKLKLTEYQSAREAILITIGPVRIFLFSTVGRVRYKLTFFFLSLRRYLTRREGFGYLPYLWGIVAGDWFVRLIKSGSLFVSMTRKRLGYAS